LSLPATAPVPVFDVVVFGDGADARVLVGEHPVSLPQHAE
jgi:hypothetical protein